MQKPKDEEEYVDSTLHTYSWETEDDRSTLNRQETEQQQLVYITNLEDDLQKNMNEEEGAKDKSL